MKTKILLLISSVFYGAIWCVFFTVLTVAYNEGVLSVFQDSFGKGFSVLAVIVLILSLTSIIYLRFFIKSVKKVHIISYVLTVTVMMAGFVLVIVGDKKFEEFSTEKWIKYPERRMTMYFDLIEKNDIVGYTYSQVESLLGQPDYITKEEMYVYDDKHGNEVYLKFDNGKVEFVNYAE